MTTDNTAAPEDTMDGECVVCPHCKERHGDAWEWAKDEPNEMLCDGCGKRFRFWRVLDVQYCAEAIL